MQEPTTQGKLFALTYPFTKAWPISSGFTAHTQRHPPSTAPGTDIAAPPGTPILAPIAGRVTGAYWRNAGGRSMWIYGETYRVYLAHMNAFQRTSGETVRAGDIVGWVGSTGNSTGPHLHVSVKNNAAWVDPQTLWTT